MKLLIEGDTKIEGKLEVGSLANVEYYARNGKNVAVDVVVTSPTSGKGVY